MKKNLSESFRGDLKKNGDFSLRNYIEDPSGRVLIIDPEPGKLDRIKPVISFVLNRAINFAMNSDTEVNMILNEIDELDEIDNVQNLCARGRSHGARCMIGVQTVGQLDAVYGKDKSGILGNCAQGMYFSPGDSETLKHMKSEISRERKKKKTRSRRIRDPLLGKDGSSTIRYREKDQIPVSEAELKNMGTGECIVVTRESWSKGKVKYWKEVVNRYI
ncbi:MAG: type IV secretion system DNA-binding domain-containing protein [Halobacteria archaeon]